MSFLVLGGIVATLAPLESLRVTVSFVDILNIVYAFPIIGELSGSVIVITPFVFI